MNSYKKPLMIITAIVAVFALVVGGSVAFLTRDSWSGDKKEHPGYLQVAVGKELVRVEPSKWCDMMLESCDPPGDQIKAPIHAALPIGEAMLVTVSHDIAIGPWVLYAMYADRDGKLLNANPEGELQRPGTTYTKTFRSTPEKVLVNIEIQPLSAVAQGEDYVARGILSLNTTPKNFTVRS